MHPEPISKTSRFTSKMSVSSEPGKSSRLALSSLFLLLFLLFLSSIPDAALAETAGLPPIPAGRYIIVPEKSRMTVFVRSTLHDFETIIPKFKGSMILPDNASPASVDFHLEFPTAELDTGNFLRDGVMRDQALEVEKYPKAEFNARKVKFVRRSGDKWEYRISGEFSIHGVERELSVPVKIWREANTLISTTEFPFRLSNHKIFPPGLLFIKVEDEVEVKIRFTFRIP